MEEEKGKWEDIIRSKIYDFEADTNLEDWDVISGKLSSGGKTVALNPYRRFGYAAAAAVAALLIVGGLYFQFDSKTADNMATTENPIEEAVVEKSLAMVEKPVENVVEKSSIVVEKAADYVEKPVNNTGKPFDNYVEKPVDNSLKTLAEGGVTTDGAAIDDTDEHPIQTRPLLIDDEDTGLQNIPDIKITEEEILYGFNDIEPEAVTMDKQLVADASQETKRRR